jgi:16S rRNA (guanine527-N7)-methyltransferase
LPPPELRPALDAGLDALGLVLDTPANDRLIAYLDLLTRWNRVYNLTAVRNPTQMLTQHLLDSLAVVGPLRRELPQPARLLDVGSGAGLPGVVIAIVLPSWQVVCIDAVAKKTRFVQQVATELGLANLAAEHGRVEAATSAARFDVITSRAFAALSDFVALTESRLADDGVWMAMKGRRPDDEISALPTAMAARVEPLRVPGLNAERCLVWLKRAP